MVSHGYCGDSGAEHMRIAFPNAEQNELLLAWLIKKLGGGIGGNPQCIAVMNEKKLVGVVAFFNFRWPNIECAFYCEDYRWALNRDGIAELFRYPFVQLKCKRVTALCDKKNYRARKMVQRMGFVEEGKLRKAGEKGDILLYGLLPDELKVVRDYGINTDSAASA